MISSPALPLRLFLMVTECSQMDMDRFGPVTAGFSLCLVGCGFLQLVADCVE